MTKTKRDDRGRLPEMRGDMLIVLQDRNGKFFDPDTHGYTSEEALRIYIPRNADDAATIKAANGFLMLA